MEVTKVVFRKFKDNSIIALFPEETNKLNYTVLSYMHIGQHGDADYNHVIKNTKPATEKEFTVLKHELENHVGYNLKVLKKSKVIF